MQVSLPSNDLGWVLKYIEDAAFWEAFRNRVQVKWEEIIVSNDLTTFKLTNLKEITVYRLRWLNIGEQDTGTKDKDLVLTTRGREKQLYLSII